MAVHTTVTCPECGKTLKPKKPLPGGKKVKCPQCGNLFVTPALAGGGEEAAKEKVQAGGPGKKEAGKAKAQPPADDKAIPLKPLDDDEEEGGIYSYVQDMTEEEEEEDKPEINYAPDTSIKDLRGPAQAAVVSPSNWLIFKGFLGFVGWLGFLVLILIPVLFPLPEDDEGERKPIASIGIGLGAGAGARAGGGAPGGGIGFVPPPAPPEEKKEAEKPNPSFFEILGIDLRVLALFPWFLIILFCLPLVVFMIYSALICFGGVTMQNLESRGWGIASAVLLILPLNAGGVMLVSCLVEQAFFRLFIDDEAFIAYMFIVTILIEWLLQVAIGVWALLTCFRPEVIDGFEYQPE
jgi:ribosomal protein S27E